MSAQAEPPPGLTHGRAVEADPSIQWRQVWSGASGQTTTAADGLLASGIAVRITAGRGWCGSPIGASDTQLHVPVADEQPARAFLAERFPQRRGRGLGRALLRIVMPWRRS